MLHARTLNLALGIFAGALLWAAPAAADISSIGGTCTSSTAQSAQATLGGNNVVCVSSAWQYPAYQFGATSAACNSTNAGMAQWTGSSVSPNNTFEFCNGSNWTAVNGAASTVSLSGITAATGGNTIDSGSNAQVWEWGTLTSGTAMSLTTSSMQGGTLLSLQDTAAAATSTGTVLSIGDATTGTGYGLYSAITGQGNIGYAGYFSNTSTTGGNYGVYVSSASQNGTAVAGISTDSSGGGGGMGVYGSGAGGNSYGVYGTDSGNIGVYGTYTGIGSAADAGVSGSATAAGNLASGVWGQNTGAGNTGKAGYFTNTATTTNYGIYSRRRAPAGATAYMDQLPPRATPDMPGISPMRAAAAMPSMRLERRLPAIAAPAHRAPPSMLRRAAMSPLQRRSMAPSAPRTE